MIANVADVAIYDTPTAPTTITTITPTGFSKVS